MVYMFMVRCLSLLSSWCLQALQNEIVEYEPRLTLLKQTAHQLTARHLDTTNEHLLRLNAQYDELAAHVTEHSHKLQDGVLLRRKHQELKTEVSTELDQLREQTSDVTMHALPAATKLEKYNVSKIIWYCLDISILFPAGFRHLTKKNYNFRPSSSILFVPWHFMRGKKYK